MLLGMKSDLIYERKVSSEEALKFAENKGLIYMECSSKEHTNITESIEFLSREILH